MSSRQQGNDYVEELEDGGSVRTAFGRQVHDVLVHLYDPVYLQTHPITRLLREKGLLQGPHYGQSLREQIFQALATLQPMAGDEASRGYKVLSLRYVEGHEPLQVQSQMGLGRRQYYREHNRALLAVISLLAERWGQGVSATLPAGRGVADSRVDEVDAPGAHSAGGGCPPVFLTSFVGRQREMADVRELLRATRLLTLTGSGGCGKTRLALQVAAECAGEFPDGVCVVELASLSDPTHIPQAVAYGLGVHEEHGRTITDVVLNYLRSRRSLVILDNCEHLLTACAELSETLLRECPQLRILVTSRQALGIGGETRWRVPSLATPSVERWSSSAAAVGQYEAVQLFVERARAVRPDFTLTSDNASAVAEVCCRLDGIPLAIELAAARARVLAAEQIAQRLDDRFSLLTGGSLTALPRHRTLRATIDWSFELTDVQAQVLFRRLAVFAGGWTLQAAEGVCSDWPYDPSTAVASVKEDHVLDLLAQLADRSLVAVETTDGEARYSFLETIRQYAAEQLALAGEDETANRRHCDWFVTYAEGEIGNMVGSHQRHCVRRLEAERANFHKALVWSQRDPDGAEAELRLAAALARYWRWVGRWKEAVTWLDDAMSRGRMAASATWARALTCRSHLEISYSGDLDRAVVLTEHAATIARAVGDARLLAFVLRQAAVVLGVKGRVNDAERYFDEAIASAVRSGDRREECSALAQKPIFCSYPVYPATTVRNLETTLAVARGLGDAALLAEIYYWLGLVLYAKEEYEQAGSALVDSAFWARSIGYWEFYTSCTAMLGDIALLTGDREGALRHYDEALDDGLSRASEGWSIEALTQLATLAAEAGFYGEATLLFAWSNTRQVTVSMNRWYRSALLSPPERRAAHGRALNAAQEQMGKEAFARAWNTGREMSVEEAGELGRKVLEKLR